jgi:putative Ca2+/H+ antiporter (TMEM165/GDT1 family)
MLTVFAATYAAVFVAEIVGDKLLYTTGVLAANYRSISIVVGMALAFMCKMAAAVAAGQLVARLPRPLVAAVTGISFLVVAYTLWKKPDIRQPKPKDARVLHGAAVAFSAILFSEWGDVGMITAAAMAAKYLATTNDKIAVGTVVWLGAVGAMVTKGTLVTFLGAGVRSWIASRVQPRIVRYVGTAALLLLGMLSVLETLGIITD